MAAPAAVTLRSRVSAAVRAYLDPTPEIVPARGERGWADPRRLFPPGRALTPYNPSALVGRRGLAVFDAMRDDDQVKAALALKKHAVTAGDWEVTPPEDAPEDHEPTRFVAATLEGLAGTFEDDLVQILTALDYGFSVTELLWGPLTSVVSREFAGRVGVTALKTRAPHAFEFEADQYGNLLALIQQQEGALRRLPTGKFLIFVHQQEFGNWYGRSDLEAAYRAWWVKDNLFRWFAMYLERRAVPGLFGVYNPRGLAPAQIEELKVLVRDFQAATSGLIPETEKDGFRFWSPDHQGNTKDLFAPAFQILDQAIARALLMPGLLGMTNDGEAGSFARAKVQFDVFLVVVEALRRQVAERVQEAIVRPLVELNYSTAEDVPRFRFLPLTDDIRLDLLDQWTRMVTGRLVTPQKEDEVHFRQVFRMPKLAKPAVADQPAPVLDLGAGGPVDGGRPQPGMMMPRDPDVREAAQLARAKSRYERAVDFAALAAGLDAREVKARAQLAAVFGRMRDKLAEAVRRAGGPLQAPAIRELRLPGRGDIQTTVTQFLLEAFEAGQASVRPALARALAQGGPGFVPQDALRFLREKGVTLSATVNTRVLDEVKRVLLFALQTGELPAETMGKLRAVFEPYVGDPSVLRDDAVIAPHRLDAILRTESTAAFNNGRLVQARDPDVARNLHGMLFSAILDARTTEVCASLDGRVIRMSDPDLDRLTPPMHVNCRSVLVPVTLDQTVDEGDFLTGAQAGRAKDLAGKGFA